MTTNLFGINAPGIAAAEGAYESMWANNVAALVGYHGAASAVAAQLTPWQQVANPAAVPPNPFRTDLRKIKVANDNRLATLETSNRAAISAAQIQFRSDLNGGWINLEAGRVGIADSDFTAAGLDATETAAKVAADDAAFVPELVGSDLVMFGTDLAP